MKKIIALIIVLIVLLCSSVGLAADKKDPMLFLYSIQGTTKTYVDLEAEPGEQATFSIELYNSGTTTKTNYLFVSDGITANNGGTEVLTPELAVREKAGSWLNIQEEEVTLKPGEKKVFDFLVDVPKSTTPGTHVAVIYLRSGINPGVESEKNQNGVSFVINEAFSLSSAVIIRTGDTPEYSFLIEDRIEKQWIKDKDLTIFFNIINNGNIYDYPKAILQMYNEEDEVFYQAENEIGVVYPGNNCIINFVIPREQYLPDNYKIVLTLEYAKEPIKTVSREFVMGITEEEVDAANTKFEEIEEEDWTSISENEVVDYSSSQSIRPNNIVDGIVLIAPILIIIALLTLLFRFLFFRNF